MNGDPDLGRLVSLASRLVRTPSVLEDEAAVAAGVAAAMRERAFDRVEIDAAGSVVGVVEGARRGPTVLFDAHLDTVDVLPVDSWSVDPFGGAVDRGRVWGRGATDMKGALAAMIEAVAGLDRDRLVGRAVVSASVSEERLEGAALRLVCDRWAPDVVVIGEASELRLVTAGRGRVELVLETHGAPAHAAHPERGEHAVLRMIDVVREIEALPAAAHPAVADGVMCLTDIVSQPFPAQSVVPSGCRATYERRLVPGESRESVLATVREACRRAGADATDVTIARSAIETYTGHRFDAEKWLPAWVLDDGSPVVSAAKDALRTVGLEAPVSSYGFCTNAAYSAGTAGIPTLGFGPGSEALAHIVDEYVAVEELRSACKGYRALAESLAPAV